MAGGHASNPGFSSTKGVHISLKRLNQLTLSPDHSTVEIGFGQVRARRPPYGAVRLGVWLTDGRRGWTFSRSSNPPGSMSSEAEPPARVLADLH
jgi:hypothetical protein